MVKTDSYLQFEAGKLTYRVVPVTEEIIRIIVSGKEIKEAQDSLIIEKKEYPEVDFSAEENAGNIIVKTTKVCAEINTASGDIIWKHADGSQWLSQKKPELTETDVIHYNTGDEEPIINRVKTVDGERNFIQNLKAEKVRTAYRGKLFFTWKEDEEIHGLGQAEEGIYNYRGHCQYLYQHNMRIPMPVLVSTEGYGILVDCCSLMTFNDDLKDSVNVSAADEKSDFAGEELSILVSAGWMDNRYDETIKRFEDTYDVTVDLQTIPADQYSDLLQSKLATDSCADIFWIQSNPFAIESTIVDPEKYCIDFTGASWENVMPETRKESCVYNDKLYGLQIWNASPEYVMVYNKTLFEENGWEVPTTYDELKELCGKIQDAGITPWFMPGADGWQHQLAFFQIGGVYEEATPGLYDELNENKATFADNEKMLEVLNEFKELSDAGYFGEDWIGTDSTNMSNEFGDRNCAMALANSSFIKQIQEDTGTSDEFGMFLEPLGDNTWYPSSNSGPTMFGYKGTEHEDLVKEFFNFVTTTESLQEILDNSPAYTNLDVNDDKLEQHWLPEEQEFLKTVPDDKKAVVTLQTGTKYTNDYWTQFGQDMVAFCQGEMEANDVLKNMDTNRAEAAKTVGDENWK